MIDPILITGCARSGTSLTAGIIDICGAFGGKTAPPNSNNKRGMFENTDIRNGIIKPYFVSIGADKMGQKPLPDIEKVKNTPKSVITDFRFDIIDVFRKHGYRRGPWYYKGAKMCLIWPIWKEMFPNAKWVIVRRDSKDIVNSCLKTSFMRAYQHEEGWQHWISVHIKRFNEMIVEGLQVRQIWPQDMINGNLNPIRDLITNFLELEWKEQEVLNFITPALWSQKKKELKNGKGD